MTSSISWRAIIVAVSRNGDGQSSAKSPTASWMESLAGVPLLGRVTANLLKVGFEGPVLLTAEDDIPVRKILARDMRFIRFVPGAGNAAASVIAAANLADHYPLLVTTADAAMLNPRLIRSFQSEAMRSGADIAIGVVTSDVMASTLPDTRHNFCRVGADRVRLANIAAILTPEGNRLFEHLSHLTIDPRRPLRLAGSFGWRSWFSHLIGATSVDKALRRVSRRLGIRVVAIRMSAAETGLDLSDSAGRALAETLLATRH